MLNKHGNKVRLHFKTGQEELWVGTKGKQPLNWILERHSLCESVLSAVIERTEKIPLASIRNVVSEAIKGDPDYHIMVGAHTYTCTHSHTHTGSPVRANGAVSILDLLGSSSVRGGNKGDNPRKMADMTTDIFHSSLFLLPAVYLYIC